MNERIKELALQAGVEYHYIDLEKFSKLFLEESIKVMMANDYHGEWLGEKLKEHFGFNK
jgi:hypothetical protein